MLVDYCAGACCRPGRVGRPNGAVQDCVGVLLAVGQLGVAGAHVARRRELGQEARRTGRMHARLRYIVVHRHRKYCKQLILYDSRVNIRAECDQTSAEEEAKTSANGDDGSDPDSEDLILSLRSRATKQIRTKLTRTSVDGLEAHILRSPTIRGMGWEQRRIMRINEL